MHTRFLGFAASHACAMAAIVVLVGGCASADKGSPDRGSPDKGSAANSDPQAAVAPSMASLATRPAGQPGIGQELFDSDDKAAAALVAAAKAHDRDEIDHIFGPSVNEFVTGDKIEDEKSFDHFAASAADHLELEKKDGNTSIIDIGKDNWPFPIPLTRLSSGKWFFDTEAGKQEILARRIGANELKAIEVCRAYVEAQVEYSHADHDGSGVFKYAQHIISRNGQDGLYWPTAAGEPQSPFGPLIAEANDEGYDLQDKSGPHPQPYHGYVFKILTSQGPHAPGGAYSYIINGNMIAGFALVAAPPSDYRTSGIMTFVISHQGKLLQKDLGPNTLEIMRAMKEYDPDATWTEVK